MFALIIEVNVKIKWLQNGKTERCNYNAAHRCGLEAYKIDEIHYSIYAMGSEVYLGCLLTAPA